MKKILAVISFIMKIKNKIDFSKLKDVWDEIVDVIDKVKIIKKDGLKLSECAELVDEIEDVIVKIDEAII